MFFDEVLDIRNILFTLVVEDHFDNDTFDVEKKNTISDLGQVRTLLLCMGNWINYLRRRNNRDVKIGESWFSELRDSSSSLEQFHPDAPIR